MVLALSRRRAIAPAEGSAHPPPHPGSGPTRSADDLPFDICNRGPFWGGAKRHDFHHSHNHGCYGDWSPFWDWAMGTDAAFWAFWAKKAPHPPTEKKKP